LDLLDAAARTDGLIVQAISRYALIGARPFGIDREWESGAGPGNRDCQGGCRNAEGGGSSYSSGGGYSSGGYSSGAGSYGGGGGGGYERGPREMFAATCSSCGKEAQVPFRPTSGKPVYCSDCFRSQRGG